MGNKQIKGKTENPFREYLWHTTLDLLLLSSLASLNIISIIHGLWRMTTEWIS